MVGYNGLKELWKYTEILRKLENIGKIKITKNCGLHTHYGNFFDKNDLGIARKFRKNYELNEHWFDSIMPKSRRLNNNGNFGHTNYIKMIKDCRENEKYCKVTHRKYEDNGTFEIRHHGGTLSFAKMANWICFNFKVLEKLVNEHYVPAVKNSFLELINEFVSDKVELVEYFLTRKALLNPSPAYAVESE